MISNKGIFTGNNIVPSGEQKNQFSKHKREKNKQVLVLLSSYTKK